MTNSRKQASVSKRFGSLSPRYRSVTVSQDKDDEER